MIVIRSAKKVPIPAVHTPTATGVHLLGGGLYAFGTALSEFVLVVAVLSLFICLWKCRGQRALAGITGMGLCFLFISALSRFSGTISVDFGPSRVQAQAYLLFIATAAVGFEGMTWRRFESIRIGRLDGRRLLLAAGAGVTALSISTSSELSNLAEVGAQPPAELSTSGQQVQRLLEPDDLLAASWVNGHRPARELVQADLYGQLALDEYGFTNRKNFFAVVEPTIVDNQSWLYAYRTNIVECVATQANGTGTSTFRFPTTFFASTRSVLYVSSTDVVFGQVPRENWELRYFPPKRHVVSSAVECRPSAQGTT